MISHLKQVRLGKRWLIKKTHSLQICEETNFYSWKLKMLHSHPPFQPPHFILHLSLLHTHRTLCRSTLAVKVKLQKCPKQIHSIHTFSLCHDSGLGPVLFTYSPLSFSLFPRLLHFFRTFQCPLFSIKLLHEFLSNPSHLTFPTHSHTCSQFPNYPRPVFKLIVFLFVPHGVDHLFLPFTCFCTPACLTALCVCIWVLFPVAIYGTANLKSGECSHIYSDGD